MKKLIVSLFVVSCAILSSSTFVATAFGHRGWAIGQWRLEQFYSEPGRDVIFKATVDISRQGGYYYGRIFYDVLGTWEPLENIIVNDNFIQFTRPVHGPQIYSGAFNGHEIVGTYRDLTLRGEWQWRAMRN
jgi:hypothetical protein